MSEGPRRIQLRRTKGWRMPPDTVSVARPTLFGNPFPVDIYGRDRAVDLHRRWLCGPMSMAELHGLSRYPETSMVGLSRLVLNAIPQLRGLNLACWCPLPAEGEPDCCHAAVLLEIANAPLRCEAAGPTHA